MSTSKENSMGKILFILESHGDHEQIYFAGNIKPQGSELIPDIVYSPEFAKSYETSSEAMRVCKAVNDSCAFYTFAVRMLRE